MPAIPTSTSWDYANLPCFPNTLGGVAFFAYFTNVTNTGNVSFSADKLAGGVDTVAMTAGSADVTSAVMDFTSFGVVVGDWVEVLAPSANAGIYQISAISGTANQTLTLDIDTDNIPYPAVPPVPFVNDAAANYRINPFEMLITHDGVPATISEFLLELPPAGPPVIYPQWSMEAEFRVLYAPEKLNSRATAVAGDLSYLSFRNEGFGATGTGGAGVMLAKSGFGIEYDDDYYEQVPDSSGYLLETSTNSEISKIRMGGEVGTGGVGTGHIEDAAVYLANHNSVFKRHTFHPNLQDFANTYIRIAANGNAYNKPTIYLKTLRARRYPETYARKPIIDVPANYAAVKGRYGRFDSTGSTDIDGHQLKGGWLLLEAPEDSTYTLSLSGCSTTDDLDGDLYTYVIEHTAFGTDPNIVAGQVLTYNNNTYYINAVGAGTADLGLLEFEDKRPLEFYFGSSWTFDDADVLPIFTTGMNVKIYKQGFSPSASQQDTALLLDEAGTYTAMGYVYSTEHFGAVKTVTVQARESATVLGESVNADFIWKYLSDSWSEIQEKEYLTEYINGLTQIAGNQLTKMWQVEKNESLRDIQPYFLYRWLDADSRVTDTEQADQTWTSGLGPMVWAPAAGAHTGETLELFISTGDPDDFESPTITVTVTTATTAQDAIDDLVSQLVAAGYSFTATHSTFAGTGYTGLTSPTLFVLTGGTSIAAGLFSATIQTNALYHSGEVISSRIYKTDRSLWGFTPNGHFLVVDGEAYEIIRVIDNVTWSGVPYNLVVVSTDLPRPSANTEQFCIPGFFLSEETNWYNELAHNGDDAVINLVESSDYTTNTLLVAGALGKKLGVMHDITDSTPDMSMDNPHWDSYTLDYVVRSNYVKVDTRSYSIPILQERIDTPTVSAVENYDHALDMYHGYRAIKYGYRTPTSYASHAVVANGYKASVSEQMWAEHIYVDHRDHISNSFGYSVNLEEEDNGQMGPLEYLSAVRGLWFIFGRGRTLENLSTGLNIFCSLPVNDVAGTITSIQNNKILQDIRIELTDADDSKKYYLVSRELGLAINPTTSAVWAVGDTVPLFSSLSNGVDTTDWVENPKWFHAIQSNADSALYNDKFWETQKYHTFKAQIPAKDYTPEYIQKVYNFIMSYRPMHTFMGDGIHAWKGFNDDIRVEEEYSTTVTIQFFEGLCGACAFVYDSECKVYDVPPVPGTSVGTYDAGALDVCPDEAVYAYLSYTFTGTPMYDTILSYDYVTSPPLPGP